VIAVAVSGAAGRMGQTVCAAVDGAADMRLAGRADPLLGTALSEVLTGADPPDVVVDFTRPDVAHENALACVRAGVHTVIGTTGFDIERLADELRSMAPAEPGAVRANVLVAPNFAIGAVLMMRFAAEAARHMDKAEIIELHHDGKLDAPSGTAARTAALMAAARGGSGPGGSGPTQPGSPTQPGPGPTQPGIPIHSVRLPGLVAHQEVILGALGQTLTIRHDSIDRVSFMPGVLLAVRRIGALQEPLTVGLESLLFE
jgi:4-hydroxy-tetrahydrodipicolinate reductase